MGFRTVVVLNNDRTHEWVDDPLLGEKIRDVAHRVGSQARRFEYGEVVECVHADTQSVVLFNMYGGQAAAWDMWKPGESADDFKLKMLKTFAEELGYKVVKKPQKKTSNELRTVQLWDCTEDILPDLKDYDGQTSTRTRPARHC